MLSCCGMYQNRLAFRGLNEQRRAFVAPVRVRFPLVQIAPFWTVSQSRSLTFCSIALSLARRDLREDPRSCSARREPLLHGASPSNSTSRTRTPSFASTVLARVVDIFVDSLRTTFQVCEHSARLSRITRPTPATGVDDLHAVLLDEGLACIRQQVHRCSTQYSGITTRRCESVESDRARTAGHDSRAER